MSDFFFLIKLMLHLENFFQKIIFFISIIQLLVLFLLKHSVNLLSFFTLEFLRKYPFFMALHFKNKFNYLQLLVLFNLSTRITLIEFNVSAAAYRGW